MASKTFEWKLKINGDEKNIHLNVFQRLKLPKNPSLFSEWEEPAISNKANDKKATAAAAFILTEFFSLMKLKIKKTIDIRTWSSQVESQPDNAVIQSICSQMIAADKFW